MISKLEYFIMREKLIHLMKRESSTKKPSKSKILEIKTLAKLIDAYDKKLYKFKKPPPQDILRFLMDSHTLSLTDLRLITSSSPERALEMIGSKSFSYSNEEATALASYFSLDESIFTNQDEK